MGKLLFILYLTDSITRVKNKLVFYVREVTAFCCQICQEDERTVWKNGDVFYSYSSCYICLPLSLKSLYVRNIFVIRGVLRKKKEDALKC